jgi:hypothetical protein
MVDMQTEHFVVLVHVKQLLMAKEQRAQLKVPMSK